MSGNSSFKVATLGVLLIAQGALLVTIANQHTAVVGHRWWEHPAEKRFRVEVLHLDDGHTESTYYEQFSAKDSSVDCGFVAIDRWNPKLHSPESYTAYLNDDSGNFTSRNFSSLAEAEEWLFSHGCPDSHWGRK
jgi:hypothetical protein